MRTSIVCLALAMACAPKKAPETPVDHPAAVVVAKKSLEQLVSSAAILLEGDVSIADAESATALMDEATKRFPDAAVAHYNLGVARYHADDLAGAQRAFERAKGLDDELAEVWLQLGRTLAARGDFGGAIGTFRSAVGRFPEDIAIRVALIDAYRQQGRPDQAIDEAKSALKVRADSVELYNSLGLAYLDTNQLSLARFVFQKALAAVEGAEDNAYLNCNLGRVYQLEGSPALARAFLTKARTLDGDLLAAQVFLAEIYMADHNYGGVVELLERAVEIDPTNTGVVLTLGVAYRGVGRFEDAEAAYRRASELDPADPSPWFNLGILFGDHTKDYEASLASFQRYLDSGGREAERARDYVKDVERERSRAEKRRNAEEERKKREAERAERQRLLEQAEREKAAAEAAAPPAPVPVEDPASVEEGAEGSDDQTPPGEDNGPWDSNDPKE